MAKTLANLRSHFTHALGGNVSADLDRDMIINDAGRHMFDMHGWKFRVKPPILVDFVQGQSFITLPEDFGEMEAYQMSDALNFTITMTTPQAIASLRATTVTIAQQSFWAAIVFPRQRSQKEIPGPPILEMYPTPSADHTDVFTLFYKSKWQELVDEADYADVPSYAESTLVQFVRAFALGWEEEGNMSLEERLAMVALGPVCQAAKETDGSLQSDFGPTVGGAIQGSSLYYDWRAATSAPIAGPS